jgi:hypothetical protein
MVARETNLVNAFETTLAAQLASGGSSMNLSADPGVDSPAYFVIDPDNDSNREVVLWSSGTDHTAATVTRDIDSKHGGTPPTHASGTKVRLAVVKQHFDEAHDAIQQGFVLEDGDGTEVTINPAVASGVYTAREVKFVEGGGIDIDWTDTDNGTDGDPYDLTFTVSVTASDIAAGTLVTESETITSNDNDTTLPTSAAVKNYADAETATLTNKTIDADNNTVSNLEVDNIKAGTLVTESEGISSNDNDTTLPTSAAVKDFVDTTIAAQGFADIGLIIALG